MRWNSLLLAALLLAASAPSVEEKRISIYSTVANYNLPVVDRDGHEYVGLLEVLEPLGTVSARTDRDRWKLRFNTIDAEFKTDKNRGKVQGHDIDLAARFVLENGRGLVPIESLSMLMPRFLGGPVSFHENSRRLFIGDVAVHFTAQIRKTPAPALVMDFSAPVNPSIATEPGKLRMVFTREPLVPPGTSTLTFDDKTIPAASFGESNGSAEIVVNSSVPLFANFSNEGRTIVVAPAPQASQGVVPPVSQPGSRNPSPSAQATPAGTGVNRPVRYFAVIDASHGGDERGAALTDQLAEKDVTLAWARRLRQNLEIHGLTSMLVRDGDSTLTLDQRAATANATRATVYVCLHATSQGNGVRVYTALLPAGGENHDPFLDWNTAQSGSLPLSQSAAVSVRAELQRRQISVRLLVAPLRPLNNVATAAMAIEIAPPTSGIADLNSADYQAAITEAIGAALLAARDKLEAPR